MEPEAFVQEPPSAINPRPVAWYRSPLALQVFKSLHKKSDWRGAFQAFGYLGLLVGTGSAAFYSAGHWPWWMTVALLFFHGTCFAFQINAVHELCHGTVFQTKFFNELFVRVFAFLGWHHFQMFQASHARHHRYTLHAPDDLEVVLPIKILARNFFLYNFFYPPGIMGPLKQTTRIARGQFRGEWELALFPEGSPERRAPIYWARTMLVGHGLIVVLSVYFHLWLLPFLTTFTPYGSWLFFLCNNTQHVGLQDDVPDFRLCCRTFTLNPFVQFLYWHMNYHIEHHMYAAVPCYNLGRLHDAIKHDLPPCPRGIIATWQEIAAIQKIQDTNPDFQYAAPLPTAGRTAEAVG